MIDHVVRVALDVGPAVMVLLSLFGGLLGERRFQRAVRLRSEALMICDRLRRDGRGLHGATREELERLLEALDS